jgi:hypothetical protein
MLSFIGRIEMAKTKLLLLSLMVVFIVVVAGNSYAAAPVNIIKNGGFESGVMDPWSTYGDMVKAEILAKDAIEGKFCLHLIIGTKPANFWDGGLQNGNQIFAKGKKYTLSAYVKSPQKLQINFKPELAADPWSGYGDKVMTTTDKWAEYYVTTPVMVADATPASVTFHITFDVGEYFMDGVFFYEGDYVAGMITPVQPKGKAATAWGQLKSN